MPAFRVHIETDLGETKTAIVNNDEFTHPKQAEDHYKRLQWYDTNLPHRIRRCTLGKIVKVEMVTDAVRNPGLPDVGL